MWSKQQQEPPMGLVLDDLTGVALVTSAFVVLIYHIMPLGPTAPMVGASDAHKHWGHRSFLNTMEQFPLFMAALWTHAIFVSPSVATTLGTIYVCIRACYPVVWLLFNEAKLEPPKANYTWLLFGGKPNIYYCTYPQYGIVMYMAVANILKLGFAFDLNALVVMPAVAAPLGFGLFLFHFSLGMYPMLQSMIKGMFKEKL